MPDIQRQYYTMKRFLGSSQFSIHDKIAFNRLHMCPGNVYHNHPRRGTLFNRKVKFGNKCYVIYWRMHPTEYKQMLDNCRQNIKSNI